MTHNSSPVAVTEALVRANQHWQQRRQSEEGAREQPACPAFSIALSREAGTYGAAIAREVGNRLGWPVYDRELLQSIADDLGVHQTLLTSVDERHANWLSRCLEGFSDGGGVNQYAYVRRLVDTLLALGARGECVVVGRGATKVFPAATTVRVRIVAPLEHRIQAVRREHGISREEAEHRVEATDRERDAFVREHFEVDAKDPRNYDLVLNAARFSVGQCAELIIAALERLRADPAPSAVAQAKETLSAV